MIIFFAQCSQYMAIQYNHLFISHLFDLVTVIGDLHSYKLEV